MGATACNTTSERLPSRGHAPPTESVSQKNKEVWATSGEGYSFSKFSTTLREILNECDVKKSLEIAYQVCSGDKSWGGGDYTNSSRTGAPS